MATATAQLTADALRQLSDRLQNKRWGACSCTTVAEIDNWLIEADRVCQMGKDAIAAGARKCNQKRLEQVARDIEQLEDQIQSTRDRRFQLEMAEVNARCEAVESMEFVPDWANVNARLAELNSNVVAFPVR